MKKALLVGINNYDGCPLRGCVNDTLRLGDFLVMHRDFSHDNVRMLHDERATTANILERLEWLLHKAAPGDVLVYQESGHGTQVPTRNPEGEMDGLDEVFCPYDFNWQDEYMIRDKQFFQMFSLIPNGVRLFWISDSCHSGDMTRNMPRRIYTSKTFKRPPDIAWRNDSAKRKNLRSYRSAGSVGLPNVGYISGCRSDQTSADTQDNSGKPCGALTDHLVNALERLPRETTLKSLVDSVSLNLYSDGYDQQPQCEGGLQGVPFAL
jgi:hypothetical protein